MENNSSEIMENIHKFLIEKSLFSNVNIHIELEKLIGFTNTNYIIIIKDKLTNKILQKYIYRKFGEISSSLNKKLEISIIKYLYDKGFGPNLLYEGKNYRICEYLENSKNLDLNHLFDEYIIINICKILNSYNLISYIYKYKITDDKIILEKINKNKEKIPVEDTQYNNIINIFYNNAEKNIKKFYNKFYENIIKNQNHKEKFENIYNFYKQFIKLYKNIIPSEGFMVINHNDSFSLNYMIRNSDKKIFIIDNEFASLNLPGYDITYYINESNFKYEYLYDYSIPKINFDKYFKDCYLKYMNEFIDNNHKVINSDNFCNEIKTKKYYLKLHLISNLFIFIYTICRMNYDEWEKNKNKEYWFLHAIYRLNLYNYCKLELDKYSK